VGGLNRWGISRLRLSCSLDSARGGFHPALWIRPGVASFGPLDSARGGFVQTFGIRPDVASSVCLLSFSRTSPTARISGWLPTTARPDLNYRPWDALPFSVQCTLWHSMHCIHSRSFSSLSLIQLSNTIALIQNCALCPSSNGNIGKMIKAVHP